jgi:hypothetical protein
MRSPYHEMVPMALHEVVPIISGVQRDQTAILLKCVEECHAAAVAADGCADACLAERPVTPTLSRCIRLSLDCAELCKTAGTIARRRIGSNTEVLRATLQACVVACRACAEECDRYAKQREFCYKCSVASRRCEDACRQVIATLHSK